jgi:hypothetical protein
MTGGHLCPRLSPSPCLGLGRRTVELSRDRPRLRYYLILIFILLLIFLPHMHLHGLLCAPVL